jgi:ribosomal protein L37E
MAKAKFYQSVLVEVKEDIIKHTYPNLKPNQKLTLEDRLPTINGVEAACEGCGSNTWIILPKQCSAIVEGGKPYIECLTCGFGTHL